MIDVSVLRKQGTSMEGKEINKSGQHTVIQQKTSRKLSEGMHLSFILKFSLNMKHSQYSNSPNC